MSATPTYMGNRKVADRLIATPLFSSEDRSLPGAADRSRLPSRQQGNTEYPAVKIRELAELGFRPYVGNGAICSTKRIGAVLFLLVSLSGGRPTGGSNGCVHSLGCFVDRVLFYKVVQ